MPPFLLASTSEGLLHPAFFVGARILASHGDGWNSYQVHRPLTAFASSNPHTEALTDPYHSIHTANYAIPGIPLPFPKSRIKTTGPFLPFNPHDINSTIPLGTPSLPSPTSYLIHTPYPYTKTKKKDPDSTQVSSPNLRIHPSSKNL
ncbi:uncharacterized protein BO66DRAFT_396979 [Aspergillus aculeatinus CBS 121060]|uniref:Uncharacterized protein n=1 Tax=Aspergillus aculeatinus CBS 121060 TaxID=1448322 RepID=A0ACD1HP13_9EURO|nr:hypothetical protein BO66DRAFT_396979 [Aspergillus aculeatinus CBS 121060]RAH75350.1 hypothetical protein BO66DRAFT_396979 [Aspergillus aculeatinus CBS 121060]